MSTTPTTSTTLPKKGTRPGIAAAARMQARLTELEAREKELEAKVQELETRGLSNEDELRLSALSLMERDIRALLPEKEREGHLPDLVGKRFSALSALASNINQADERTRRRFGFMPEALNLKQIIDKWESAFQSEYDRAEREIQKAESYRREVASRDITIEGLRAQLKALDQKGQAIRDALPPDTQALSLEEAVAVTLERLAQDKAGIAEQLKSAEALTDQIEQERDQWYRKCVDTMKRADIWMYWFFGTSSIGATIAWLKFFGGPK